MSQPIPRTRALVPREDVPWFEKEYPCGRCGRLTHYGDISFCIPLCPWPCYDAMWREYWEALKR